MFALNIFVFSILTHIILVAGDLTSARNECLESNNLKLEDLKGRNKDVNPTEPQYCFFKCMMEKSGELKPDGTIDIDMVNKCPIFSKFADSDKEKIRNCLKGIDKIMECADMENVHECHKDIKGFEASKFMET